MQLIINNNIINENTLGFKMLFIAPYRQDYLMIYHDILFYWLFVILFCKTFSMNFLFLELMELIDRF